MMTRLRQRLHSDQLNNAVIILLALMPVVLVTCPGATADALPFHSDYGNNDASAINSADGSKARTWISRRVVRSAGRGGVSAPLMALAGMLAAAVLAYTIIVCFRRLSGSEKSMRARSLAQEDDASDADPCSSTANGAGAVEESQNDDESDRKGDGDRRPAPRAPLQTSAGDDRESDTGSPAAPAPGGYGSPDLTEEEMLYLTGLVPAYGNNETSIFSETSAGGERQSDAEDAAAAAPGGDGMVERPDAQPLQQKKLLKAPEGLMGPIEDVDDSEVDQVPGARGQQVSTILYHTLLHQYGQLMHVLRNPGKPLRPVLESTLETLDEGLKLLESLPEVRPHHGDRASDTAGEEERSDVEGAVGGDETSRGDTRSPTEIAKQNLRKIQSLIAQMQSTGQAITTTALLLDMASQVVSLYRSEQVEHAGALAAETSERQGDSIVEDPNSSGDPNESIGSPGEDSSDTHKPHTEPAGVSGSREQDERDDGHSDTPGGGESDNFQD